MDNPYRRNERSKEVAAIRLLPQMMR